MDGLIDTDRDAKIRVTASQTVEGISKFGGIGTHFSRGGLGGSNGSVSASYSDITNDLQSGIHGGKYSGLTAADVQAAKDSNGYYTPKTYNGSDIFIRFNDFNGGVNVLAYETKNTCGATAVSTLTC